MKPQAFATKIRLRFIRTVILLAAALFTPAVVLALPLEAVQRSIQQRWAVAHGGANCTFPLRSDGGNPGLYPVDGFYGPSDTNTVIADIEDKVFASLTQEYVLFSDLEGSNLGIFHAAQKFYYSGVPSQLVSTVISQASSSSTVDQRLARAEEALLLCHQIAFGIYPDTAQERSGEGVVGDPGPNCPPPPACGSSYDPAVGDWRRHDWTQWGGTPWLSEQMFGEYAWGGTEGGGGGTCFRDDIRLYTRTAQLSVAKGDSPGELVFYIAVSPFSPLGGNNSLPTCPVPADSNWHAIDQKCGNGTVTSRWIPVDPSDINATPPALPPVDPNCRYSGGWFVFMCGGMFRGQFTDTWACDNTWTATNTTNAPSARYDSSSVWTGNELIVWGGNDGSNLLNTGGKYNPTTDSWTATGTTNAPAARSGNLAVWSGSEMMVWGGGTSFLNTGGKYNPGTDTWTGITATGAPSARYGHTVLWALNELSGRVSVMIVWGGYDSGGLTNTGARYDPAQNTWTAMSTQNAPSARAHHVAVWVGKGHDVYYPKMIVYGGVDANGNYLHTGGVYDPFTDTWSATSTTSVPSDRSLDKAIWSGTEMIIWGGKDASSNLLNTGARYNPNTNSWAPVSGTNAPSARSSHGMVWDGSEMIVWSGQTALNTDPPTYTNTGGRYNPVTNTWTATTTSNAPSGRAAFATVVDSHMIVWGGNVADGSSTNTGGKYCSTPVTYCPTVSISGTVTYCSNPTNPPVPGVTMSREGDSTSITTTDASGNYTFPDVVSGGSYKVTPSKAALAPGSSNINNVDVLAIQKHYLAITLLTGCRLAAADVDGNGVVNSVDVLAVKAFFLGQQSGYANTGKYKFTPAFRVYTGVTGNQTGQNYDTIIFGDVASGFIYRPGSASESVEGDSTIGDEMPATVAAVTLPTVAIESFVRTFTVQVSTTAIDRRNELVGFQGDLIFDERVITFQSEPVEKAGLTGGNWSVSGNVLPGDGPIRTLRVAGHSNDFIPLSGSGTLFELKMLRMGKAAGGTPLHWAAPPDHFFFIDADLKTQKPGNATAGGVTASEERVK